MKLGYRHIFRDTGEGSGGAAAPDRMALLEQRLAQVTQAVTGIAQHTAQAQQAQQAEQERQRELAGVQNIVDTAAQKLQTARAKLAAAHSDGDPQQIAAATADLSEAVTEHTAARMHADTLRHQLTQQSQQPQRQTQEPARVDDSNMRAWRERNKDWYGVDPEMTRAALEVAKEIETERVLETGSVQYFQAVDARLRSRYGDRMPRASSAAQMQTPRGNMQGNPAPTQNRIPESVAAGFRRMGIDIDNPDTAKKLIAARATAVQKGFLPETPASGAVITR